MNQTVKPLIDDAYWFEYSKQLVEGKQAKREAAAAAIQKLVVWLWGIYTASAAIGFTLSGKELSFWPAMIIAAASGALILVYWGTVWVQAPSPSVNFDPRSPTEIKQVHYEDVKTKSFRLNLTLFGSLIAAIMVSIALVVASVSKPVKQDLSDINAKLVELDGRQLLSVTAWVGEADEVEISITPVLEKARRGEIIRTLVLPSREGLLQTSIEIRDRPLTRIQLELGWTSKQGTEIRLGKGIEPESRD